MTDDNYDEVIEALKKKTGGFMDQAEADDEDISHDAFLQVVQDCSEVCDLYDVPSDDRVELICEAIRQDGYDRVDQATDQLRWQLQIMKDL